MREVLKKVSSVYRKCTVFQVLFKTNSYFCWLSFLHSVWVRKPKKWQQPPVTDHFNSREDFLSELFFLDDGLKSQQGTVQLFWNKIKFEGFTIDFKGKKWLPWPRCLELDKRKRPEVWKKTARTRTIKSSCELSAGAGKFPPITRENRRQSLPAEIFACIRRYFYLRISVLAAFAGIFARASFTVYGILNMKSFRYIVLDAC